MLNGYDDIDYLLSMKNEIEQFDEAQQRELLKVSN